MPIIKLEKIWMSPYPHLLCALPYPGHPKGCPNLGKKCGCPPYASMIFDHIQLPYYAIVNEFNLESHVDSLRIRHPTWSERQLECCLYWQPKARKQLNKLIKDFLHE